jgi:hypothetical protein
MWFWALVLVLATALVSIAIQSSCPD